MGARYLFDILEGMKKPSNNRDWSPDVAVLSYADIGGSAAVIHNVRNFTYRSEFDYTPAYYDKTVDFSDIFSVDFIYVPFSLDLAHMVLSFGFRDGSHIALSVEVRRQKGEHFSLWKEIVRRSEIVYIIADEKDVLKLRTNFRKNDVYRYSLDLSQTEMQALLKDVLLRANALREHPEFYRALRSNCMSNLFYHIRKATGRRVWGLGFLISKVADRMLYNRGFMDSTKSFTDLKRAGLITPKAQEYGDHPDFSRKVRG